MCFCILWKLYDSCNYSCCLCVCVFGQFSWYLFAHVVWLFCLCVCSFYWCFFSYLIHLEGLYFSFMFLCFFLSHFPSFQHLFPPFVHSNISLVIRITSFFSFLLAKCLKCEWMCLWFSPSPDHRNMKQLREERRPTAKAFEEMGKKGWGGPADVAYAEDILWRVMELALLFSKHLTNSPFAAIKQLSLHPLKSPLLCTDRADSVTSGAGWRRMLSWHHVCWCVCVCSQGSVSYMPSSCAIGAVIGHLRHI